MESDVESVRLTASDCSGSGATMNRPRDGWTHSTRSAAAAGCVACVTR